MVTLRFAYLPLLYLLIPLFLLLLVYRCWFYRGIIYRFSLTDYLVAHGKAVNNNLGKYALICLRAAQLSVLMLLIARPQWVDSKTHVNVHGVDIIVSIDVSGSMNLFDDLQDRRPRIEVAKTEALSFIEKRPDDQIGVVIFAEDALSLCPLTLDKTILQESVSNLFIGFIPAGGTAIGTGLATAVNRLKNSQAKSKIIIFLTDGRATPEEKISPQQAIDLAKQFGVKVYSIALGNDNGGYNIHPIFGGLAACGPDQIDKPLLRMIAKETGGQFFEAHNPQELKKIYTAIDKLEKTEYETDIFHRYYEAYKQFIWVFFLLLALELFCRLWVWRSL